LAGKEGWSEKSLVGRMVRFRFGDLAIDVGTNFTVSYWVKSTNTTDQMENLFFSENGYGYAVAFNRGSGGDIDFALYDGEISSEARARDTSNNWSDGDWHQIVAVKRGNTANDMYIYVDGVETVDSRQDGGTLSSSVENVDYHIGAGNNGGNIRRRFEGSLCDFRYYDRALSYQEIQALYRQSSGDYARPLNNNNSGIARYALDDDSDTSTATDSWGGNNGSISGASYTSDAVRGKALSFNASNGDYVDLPTFGLNDGDPLSVSVWAKKNNLNDDQVIFGENRYEVGYNITGEGTSSGGYEANGYDGSNNFEIASNIKIANAWLHHVVSYGGSNFAYYINGRLIDSISA